MRSRTLRLTACALAVSFLFLPPVLSAKERRGATLIVTRLDGSQVRGELIAVKPDSLLLLNNLAREESVGLPEIESIRIVRKSRAGKGALFGFLGGALFGAIGASGGVDEWTPAQASAIFGAIFGTIGGLSGLTLGAILGVDATMAVAGEPEALVSSKLEKLRGFSREGRLTGARTQAGIAPIPETRQPAPAPVIAQGAPSRRRHTPRFRLSVPLTVALMTERREAGPAQGSFRFLGDVPSGEAGPYQMPLGRYYSSSGRRLAGIGSLSFAYEWSERWSAEIEIVYSGWPPGMSEYGTPSFTSAGDGKTYRNDYLNSFYRTYFSAVLLGLTYRPFAPSEFRRHIVEAGLAVGPSWARLKGVGLVDTPLSAGKLTFSARAHAAYDLYFLPKVSIGAIVGYRYFRADFPESTETSNLVFVDMADPIPENSILRLTELTVPPRKVEGSGFYIGLRLGLRF